MIWQRFRIENSRTFTTPRRLCLLGFNRDTVTISSISFFRPACLKFFVCFTCVVVQLQRSEQELQRKDKHIQAVMSVVLEDSQNVSNPTTELLAVLRNEKSVHGALKEKYKRISHDFSQVEKEFTHLRASLKFTEAKEMQVTN